MTIINKTFVAVLALCGAVAAAPAARADSFSFSIGTPVYGGYAPAYVPAYAPPVYYGGGYGYGGYAPAPVYHAPVYSGPAYSGYYPAPRPYYGGYNSGFRVSYRDWDGPRGGFYNHGPRHREPGFRGGSHGGNFYRTVAPNHGRPEGRGGQWHGGR